MSSKLESKIKELISDTLESMGLESVRVRIISAKNKIVEILIARLDNDNVSVGDCQQANIEISALLDVEDIFDCEYMLEVSSAGIERPLVELKDFTRFANNMVAVKLEQPINDQKKYQAILTGTDGDDVVLATENGPVNLPFSNIKSDNIVLTNDMIRKI